MSEVSKNDVGVGHPRTSMLPRKIRRLAVASMIGSVVFVAGAWLVGGSLVAPANRPVGPPPQDLAVESTTIESESGARLAAWYNPCENATATVLLLHPVRSDRRAMLGRAKLLHENGYATLLVDLQAHGESTGDRITAGYLEQHDVVAAVTFVKSRSPGHKIGVIGWSLGGAAALLASPLEIDALVLESVYPTIDEAVRNRIAMRLGPLHHVLAPALLVQLKPRLGVSASRLRPIDHIADVGCPVLVAGGDLDRHTKLAETNRMFAAADSPKQLSIFDGASHTDLLKHDRDRYKIEVIGFLNNYLR